VTAQPYLALEAAAPAVAFYEQAFGADFFHSVYADDGVTLVHGRLRIGDDVIMLFEPDEAAPIGVRPPGPGHATTVIVRLTVADRATVDRFADTAAQLRAEIKMGPVVAPWGEYYVRMIDPFGHCWAFGTDAA